MPRLLLIATGLLAILALGAWGALRWGHARYDRAGPLAEGRAVVIPRGSPAQLADVLIAAGVIDDTLAFQVAAELTRTTGKLHAGEFAFPAGASLRQVLAILRTGRPVQHRLTIPEGLTAAQIARLLDSADALEGETPLPEEGAVMPDTYAYERADTRAAVLARAVAARGRVLHEIWLGRTPDPLLPDEASLLILASIVERETARPDERPRIAAVFLNRLRRGMKLQSDPTVAYGVSGGAGVLDHALTREELDRPNPYNTYVGSGLPPGPICSPGRASLLAVAQPAASEALFFVADGSGGHAFAATLEEHQRNVARWRGH